MTETLAVPPSDIRRIAFLGTPEVSATALRALVEAGFEVPLVISRPDKRRGRGSGLIASPVKAAAVELGLPVSDSLADLDDVDVDLGVVVAYGRIIPVSVLTRVPMVNIHFSLLPRWRGAAPVERAILAGDVTTGVCLMEVAEGLDEGGVYAVERVDIDDDESATELRSRLGDVGAELLVRSLKSGLGPAEPQCGEPTYAAKLDREEARLDFTRPAVDLHRTVRVGRAWAQFRGKRLGIEKTAVTPPDIGEAGTDQNPFRLGAGEPGTIEGTTVSTGDGLLELVMVKPEGKRAMTATDWRNGVQPGPGERLV